MLNLLTKPVQLNASVPKTSNQNDFQTNPTLEISPKYVQSCKSRNFSQVLSQNPRKRFCLRHEANF